MLKKLVLISTKIDRNKWRTGWMFGILIVALLLGFIASAGFKSDVIDNEGLHLDAIIPALFFFGASIVISIFGDYSHARLEHYMNSRFIHPEKLLENGDLENAVGTTIAVLLADTSKTDPRVTHNTRDWIKRNQSKIPGLWHDIVEQETSKNNTGWFSELLPEKLSDIIKNRPQALAGTRWFEILSRLGEAANDDFPATEGQPSTIALVERLSNEFCRIFWEYIKEDFVREGHAAQALNLVIKREILDKLDSIKATGEYTNTMVNEVHKLLIGDGRVVTPAEDAEIAAAIERAHRAEQQRDELSQQVKKLTDQLATLAPPPTPKRSDSNLRFLAINYFQIAYDLAIAGRYAEALPYLDLTLELDPKYAQAYYNRGVVKSDLGRKEEALSDYNKAIELDPKYARAYSNRGVVKSDLGRKEEALSDYNKAIELDPKYARAYSNRGVVKSDLGHREEALSDYNKAIELDPKLAQAYSNRGVVKSDLGRKEEALSDYNKAIELDPKLARAYSNRGVVKSDLGRKEEALSDYNKAIELDPKYAQAYYNRGNVKSDLGRKEEALADYNKAIELDPKDAQAYSNRGVVKSDLGRKEEALSDYNKAIELDPKLARAYSNRGNVKSDLGRKEEALSDYNKAIELDPKYAQAYYNQGNVKSDLGRKEEALADYNKAIELDPKYAQAYYNRACLFAGIGELDKMETDLARAISIDPEYRVSAPRDPDFKDVLNTPEFRRAIGNP